MKKLSTLSKPLVMALSMASISVVTVAVSQAATTKAPSSEQQAASQSKIDLEQALLLANKAVKGDIVSVGYDQEDRTVNGNYEIKIITNNNEQEVKVHANTGKVTKEEVERLDKEDMAEYKSMKQAKLTLTQAISKANQTLKGTVLEAEFETDFGKPVYKVEIGKDNQVYKIVIDSTTGNIIRSQARAADSDD
ncbi:MAG: PepSY domain-containing protein [Psychrobacter sp.]|nr:PepSY domain-containing protein [Psychrobacter sp.]